MRLRGETVTVDLAATGNIAGFNNGGFERVEVENVLVAPEDAAELGEMPLQDGAFYAIRAYFPKTFTRSLLGARIHYRGRVYAVEGDPQPYPAAYAPGAWNLAAYAYTTNTAAAGVD